MSNKKMDDMILSESDSSRLQISRYTWMWLGLTIFLTCFAIWSAPKIPFHPDESTYLFMSRDFDLLWTSPSALIWTPAQAGDLRAQPLEEVPSLSRLFQLIVHFRPPCYESRTV